MKKHYWWGAVALLCITGVARADSIGPNCDTCQGSVYTLTYAPAGMNTWDITLTIATSGYNGGGTLLDDVAFKATSQFPTSVTILQAPGGAGQWTIMLGGLNAGGCDGSGNGFVCAFANTLADAASVPNGTPYVWEFQIVTTQALLTGPFEASIKGRYTDNNGNKVGDLVSEDITLQPAAAIPEPSALLLFGSGLVALGGLARRRLMGPH